VVVSLAESSESYVMQKLARKLGVPIPELKIKDGIIEPIGASDSSEPAVAATAETGKN